MAPPIAIVGDWSDPKTLISLGSLCVGVAGFLYGVLSHYWNRRESRLNALSSVLQPTFRAAQHLHRANDLRRKCERLKASFPDPVGAPEAAQRVNHMVAEYGETLKAAEKEFRVAESEFGSRSFRFPDRICSLVDAARESLSEYGRLVNDGLFDRADVQFARFRDDYRQVTRVARGWRLADPLEGIRKRLRRKEETKTPSNRFDLSDVDMRSLLDLVHKRVTTQAGKSFAVHPPQKLIDNPELKRSDRVIDELQDSVFVVVFQDGTTRMMSLVELMVFNYLLIDLAIEHANVSRMMRDVPPGEYSIEVKTQLVVSDIMRPEMVKVLLDKLDFSNVASDTPGS